MKKCLFLSTANRVQCHTSDKANQKIKEETLNNINYYRGRSDVEISNRIKELNNEWDIERFLETNASILIVLGSILSITSNKKYWPFFTGAIGGFLLQHAIKGWCPPLPIIRNLGIRTSSEIDEEKFYLKYLRGDYQKWSSQTDNN
ncbi:DUF2892 domain-containing protein [Clostridium sp. OS1-26]|uniref:DUF2892 domain-containing protein n=1 Tax=Clostridium sp. OS1-26 TaxID=3070681 RepID=UPI0027DFDA6D|nr:DUF2892 domain-containing protein [Clostridium sp. OS1-26]WML35419.1 DUF2892 domain-containing protein [Clostridium sp. OS1-26]